MPYADNGSVALYHETFGDRGNPALLLVNGLGSQCTRYPLEWCEQFVQAGFFVIRFDNRDVGLSTTFDDSTEETPYLLTDMAADALAVLDAAGVARAHIMGLSMGAMIGQIIAIEHPERILTLTSAMSTTGHPDMGHASQEALEILSTPPPAGREGAIERAIRAAQAYGSPAHIDIGRLSRSAAADFDRSWHPAGVTRQLNAVRASGDRSEALRTVEVPTLVIHGDQDRLIDITGGVHTAEVMPNATLEIIEGMGHDYPPGLWDRIVELVRTHAGLN